MKLSEFLGFLSIVLGIAATGFLSKALFTSSDTIVRTMYHYSPIGWPSPEIIADKAGPKADTLAALILVFFAAALQLVAIINRADIRFTVTLKAGLTIGCAFAAAIILVVWQISSGAREHFEVEIKRLVAKKYLRQEIEEASGPLYKDVEAIAKQYFKFERTIGEEYPVFIRRFALYLDYELPQNMSFSKFR